MHRLNKKKKKGKRQGGKNKQQVLKTERVNKRKTGKGKRGLSANIWRWSEVAGTERQDRGNKKL